MPWRRTSGCTRVKASLAVFEYIDGFYNPRRIQKRLGYLSPIEYEEKHYANQAASEPETMPTRPDQSTAQLLRRLMTSLALLTLRFWKERSLFSVEDLFLTMRA
ncbi:IS3 family transposase [Streptomyces sp. NPDC101194]|uniref:IS3 family transposase n=1 Tax=Streptomyces sp. NPDC101194 TaxID=3366127 RepID=UPI0037F31002